VQETLPVFTSAFGPEDEFALYLFHTYARRVLGFSRDRDKLHAAFRALEWMGVPVRVGRKFRNIEVRVRRPGVTLLTYDGYFAGIPTE
jgi:hypothetical protein